MSEHLMKYSKELKDILNRSEKILDGYINFVEPIFKYPRHRELEASMEILPKTCQLNFVNLLEEIYQTINGSNICIIGPGNVNKDIYCKYFAGPEGGLINSINNGFNFLYVTADLDSSLKLIGELDWLSKYKFIHVHGDNYTRLRIINYEGEFVYTTQVNTPYCALPVGAFTDGDRAIALSMIFNAKIIDIHGFDFKNVNCSHKDYCFNEKIDKLKVSQELIKYMADKLGYNIKYEENIIRLVQSNS